jgi:2-C-methyl-D-erythritol 4-phosphate cytidylyltransferase
LLRETRKHGAAIPAFPVTDTVKVEGKKGFLTRTVDRSGLWAVQTPQCFDYQLLVRAHRSAMAEGITATDDAALVELLGVPARIVEGYRRNLKITDRTDLRLAKIWLKTGERD